MGLKGLKELKELKELNTILSSEAGGVGPSVLLCALTHSTGGRARASFAVK